MGYLYTCVVLHLSRNCMINLYEIVCIEKRFEKLLKFRSIIDEYHDKTHFGLKITLNSINPIAYVQRRV